MIIKVNTSIYIDVQDEEQGEEAASTINTRLADIIGPGFPAGEIVVVEVENFEEVTDTATLRNITE